MSNNQIAIYNLICRESLTSTVKMICENISIDKIFTSMNRVFTTTNSFFMSWWDSSLGSQHHFKKAQSLESISGFLCFLQRIRGPRNCFPFTWTEQMKFANSKTRTDKDLPFKRASQTKSCIWQNKTLKYNVNRPAPVYRNQVKCDSALYNGFNSQVSPA